MFENCLQTGRIGGFGHGFRGDGKQFKNGALLKRCSHNNHDISLTDFPQTRIQNDRTSLICVFKFILCRNVPGVLRYMGNIGLWRAIINRVSIFALQSSIRFLEEEATSSSRPPSPIRSNRSILHKASNKRPSPNDLRVRS